MKRKLVGGRYELVRGIGTGGMAVVYEARHTATGKRVALKLLRHESRGLDTETRERLRQRFLREMRATSELDTPHVASVFDAGCDEESGDLFIAMELCEGEDLKQLLARVSRLRPYVALRLIAQALAGLEQAHAAGIVHRDLKPANLFLDRDGDGMITLKVLDFGIAKFLSLRRTLNPVGSTTLDGVVGTPAYMSPEQVSGGPIEPCSDVWSLGVVLYKAITGTTPFASQPLADLALGICGEPAPAITTLSPWVPPAIAEIVHRALAIAPADRYRDASEMLEHVRRVVSGTRAVSLDELVAYTPEVSVPETLDVATTRIHRVSASWPRVTFPAPRRRGTMLAVAIVVVTYLIVVAWALTLLERQRDQPGTLFEPPPRESRSGSVAAGWLFARERR